MSGSSTAIAIIHTMAGPFWAAALLVAMAGEASTRSPPDMRSRPLPSHGADLLPPLRPPLQTRGAGGLPSRPRDPGEDKRWSACTDLAGCLGLEPTPDAEVRVTLNLMFIGFQGDGNLGAYLRARARLGAHLAVPDRAACLRSRLLNRCGP